MILKVAEVRLTPECVAQLKAGKELFTEGDLAAFKKWQEEMEKFGPDYIEASPNYNDHPLTRDLKWQGCRSSCLGFSMRVIYKMVHDKILIAEVQKISPSHNYK